MNVSNVVLVFGFAVCFAILGNLALEMMAEPDPEVLQAKADLERSKRKLDDLIDELSETRAKLPNCAAGGAHATTADP